MITNTTGRVERAPLAVSRSGRRWSPVGSAMTVAAVTLAFVLALAACAPDPPAPGAAPAADPPPPLMVPSGHRVVLDATVARGSQVYACARGAWSLLAPAAVLSAPATDLLHTAGPRWIATVDGSALTAAPVATVPVPGAAPELLLRAAGHDGPGLLAAVDFVQRLAVRGGATPVGPCADGERRAVDYSAEYRFWAPTS